MKKLRIAAVQIDTIVGGLESNRGKIADYIKLSKQAGADIVSFPELAITGYPPEDLLLKRGFVDDNIECLNELVKTIGDIVCIIGFVDRSRDELYNAAAVIYRHEIIGVYHKVLLPNYGVFDEKRYFAPGKQEGIYAVAGASFAVNICEDIWHNDGPIKKQVSEGASLIININASPYYSGRIKERERVVRAQAKLNNIAISYTNLVGGQDELVFDGQSMIADSHGRIITRAKPFREDMILADLELPDAGRAATTVSISDNLPSGNAARPPIERREAILLDTTAETYQALQLGLKDYALKNGFKKSVFGMSGGIDSAIVAAIAADAMGRENVTGVFMSTRYSSNRSEEDARIVASNLGIGFMPISIEQIFKLYLMALETKFAGLPRDITEENLQARIRGNILMALSNKFGWLVLTTGNKSEMSTGYATLYGDMAGGFAVLKDVTKTMVYKLARYRNTLGTVIPEGVITKEPTAELRPDQKDRDTLPPYEILDKILKAYVEEDRNASDIISAGFDRGMVERVVRMVDRSEYKRRQSPPGIKITPKAFGRDRRMPITNMYR